jgi:hypothetical protein
MLKGMDNVRNDPPTASREIRTLNGNIAVPPSLSAVEKVGA